MPTRIKRYEEKLENLDGLLTRIETEMGPEAQLEAREFRRNGLLGLVGGQRMVEIIATLSIDERSRPEPAAVAAGIPDVGSMLEAQPAERDLLLARQEQPAADSVQIGRRRISGQPAMSARELHGDVDASSQLREAFSRSREEAQHGAAPQLSVVSPAAAEPRHSVKAAEPAVDNTGINELRSSVEEIRGMLQGLASRQAEQDRLLREQARTVSEVQPRVASELQRLERTFRVQREELEERQAQHVAEQPACDDPQLEALRQGLLLDDFRLAAFRQLADWNIPPQDCLELIDNAMQRDPAIDSESGLLAAVHHEISRGILLKGGLRLPEGSRRVVALVGPTGVGKTTTIAKIAAQAVFEQGRRVAVISMDNYRIAAVEQMRSYAEIMGLRFEVVFSPQEYADCLAGLQDYDLVLVDTAGRSPSSPAQIAETAAMLEAAPPDEVHLVITAGTQSADISRIVEAFAVLGCDQLIVSKLDEARGPGGIHNLGRLCSLPVSYFTTGQSVPEDIRSADPDCVSDVLCMEEN